MGKKDDALRSYFTNKERFADLFNGFLYDGQQVVNPDELYDVDPVTSEVYKEGTKLKTDKRERDMIQAMQVKDRIYVLYGIEHQSEEDWTMPLRTMEYEIRHYRRQLKRNTKEPVMLKPIITLVVYWQPAEWQQPKSLLEMMYPEQLQYLEAVGGLQYVQDHKINLVQLGCLDEKKLQQFRTDLQHVLGYIRYSNDKTELKRYLADGKVFSAETTETLSILTGTRIPRAKGEENVIMSKALDDIRAEGIEQGREEGKAEGREEGKAEGKREATAENIVSIMDYQNVSYDDAAKMLSIPEEDKELVRLRAEKIMEERSTQEPVFRGIRR